MFIEYNYVYLGQLFIPVRCLNKKGTFLVHNRLKSTLGRNVEKIILLNNI